MRRHCALALHTSLALNKKRNEPWYNSMHLNMNKRFWLTLFLLPLLHTNAASPEQGLQAVRREQSRIDLIDGTEDRTLRFTGTALTKRAQYLYFDLIDRIAANIIQRSQGSEQETYLNILAQDLVGINRTNYQYLSSYEQYFDLLNQLFQNAGEAKELELVQNRVLTGLKMIPYILNRSWFRNFLKYAAGVYPYEVLRVYQDFSNEFYALEILELVAINDPNAIKQYLGTYHPVNMLIQTSNDPVVQTLLDIHVSQGSRARAYTFIDWIYGGKISLEAAETLCNTPDAYFGKLVELRKKKNILGAYSVDQELGALALDKIRKLNLLHDESDAVRFESVKYNTAEELYSLMVYGQEEIFTSTFNGLYKRLMERRPDSSGFGFLKRMGMNKFRTFVKMCAGYNTLQNFLNTMEPFERGVLIDEVVKGIDRTGGNLAPAVEVADIFGSITDPQLKEKFIGRLKLELEANVAQGHDYGIRLFGLLYKLAGRDPVSITGNAFSFDIPDLVNIERSLLFPGNKHVQLHVFYNDEDGASSYQSFIQSYLVDKVNWQVTPQPGYSVISARTGQQVVIYANKPQDHETAIPQLMSMFEQAQHLPDLVVHRGHSYHLTGTIELLNSSTRVAILGSCGGYQNISRVLDQAAEAQIVSSKQIGTFTVNNVLLKDLSDVLREGKNLNWQELWLQLDKKLSANARWADYIPPYKNLGMRFIKAFQQI